MPGGRPATIITQRDLEIFFGAVEVQRVFDVQRRGQANSTKLETVLRATTDRVTGKTLGGFSLAQMTELAARDYNVKLLCAQIAMGIGSIGTPGILDDQGKNPYRAIQEQAEKELKAIVKAEADGRIAAEEQVGRNAKLGVSVRPRQRSVFASTTDNPKPGGF